MPRAARAGEGIRRVEDEIRREKAAALGRAGERLAEALHEVAALGETIDATGDPVRRAALLEDYGAARRRAERARLMLVIQREAVGVRRHAVVDQQFPVPPRRSADGARAPSP